MPLVHLINECDIRTRSKDQRKLLIGRSEDVVDRINGPIENLDILHVLIFIRLAWTGSDRLEIASRAARRIHSSLSRSLAASSMSG